MNQFSPSSLGTFKDCHRCFWLEKNLSVKRPRGIFPSLPGGMDRIIKEMVDTLRASSEMLLGLEIEVNLSGVQFFKDQSALNKMRNWRSGLTYIGAEGKMIGAIDDLMTVPDAEGNLFYIPTDWKTKGSVAKEEDAIKYYQTQLDCYALLLDANKMPTTGFGLLVYFSPKEMESLTQFSFNVQTFKIPTSVARAKALMQEASECLKLKMPPDSSSECEYCGYFKTRYEETKNYQITQN